MSIYKTKRMAEAPDGDLMIEAVISQTVTIPIQVSAPVLICPVPIASTKSAMFVSSASPERCDTIAVQEGSLSNDRLTIVLSYWVQLFRVWNPLRSEYWSRQVDFRRNLTSKS